MHDTHVCNIYRTQKIFLKNSRVKKYLLVNKFFWLKTFGEVSIDLVKKKNRGMKNENNGAGLKVFLGGRENKTWVESDQPDIRFLVKINSWSKIVLGRQKILVKNI